MEMVGTVKSNTFRVHDERAFRTWFERFRFGSETELINGDAAASDAGIQKRGTPLCLYGSELYPSAFPKLAYDDDDPEPEEREANLNDFATAMRAHLCHGEAFYVIACGAEGERYAAYEELAITAEGEVFRCATSDSTDNADAHRLIAEHGAR